MRSDWEWCACASMCCPAEPGPEPMWRPHTVIHRAAMATLVTAFLSGAAAYPSPAPPDYSLSVEVEYGRKPSRRSYIEQMQRKLAAWAGARGRLHAPAERSTADLHLQVVVDEVDRGRGYAEISGERDVFVDMPTSVSSPWVYHTRFELHVAVVDPRRGNRVLVEERFTIYNETRETKVLSNPAQRSWDDNLQFMVDRIRRFLARRSGRIRRYLRDNPRLPTAPPGSDEPR